MGDVGITALPPLALVTLRCHLIGPPDQAEIRARPPGLQRGAKSRDRVAFDCPRRLLLALVAAAANQFDAAPGARLGQGRRGSRTAAGGGRRPRLVRRSMSCCSTVTSRWQAGVKATWAMSSLCAGPQNTLPPPCSVVIPRSDERKITSFSAEEKGRWE